MPKPPFQSAGQPGQPVVVSGSELAGRWPTMYHGIELFHPSSQVVPVQDVPRAWQRRQLPLAKLNLTVGEDLHRAVVLAESSQDTSHALVRVWIHGSNERHAALTNVHAHGSAGDDLERFLLVGVAEPQVSAVQTNRGDVRSARHARPPLAGARAPGHPVGVRCAACALAPCLARWLRPPEATAPATRMTGHRESWRPSGSGRTPTLPTASAGGERRFQRGQSTRSAATSVLVRQPGQTGCGSGLRGNP